MNLPLETILKHTLVEVENFYRLGLVEEETYKKFLHTWQTSTFRFTQHCFCKICNAKDWS